MSRSLVAVFALVVSASLFASVGAVPAVAKKSKGGARGPEKVFAGKVLFSKKRFPTAAGSARAYIAKLKKQRTDKFWEDKKTKSWKVYYAAFFRRPLNDLEITVKLWDVSSGRKQLITSLEQYLDRRGERAIISSIELERKFFGVNKKILMTVEDHRGREYASGSFRILGEAERYTGQVSFTEDETKGDIQYDSE